MLDGLTLDLLRTLIASVDEGSFSAAGRRLHRTQSVVSQSIANLEDQLGLRLFDRIGRYPKPTPAGTRLVEEARSIMRSVDGFRAQARDFAGGLEPELSIVVDVIFPQTRLTAAMVNFAERFPATTLRLQVEALGAVAELVLAGSCSLGITGTLPVLPPGLEREYLFDIPMVTVAGPGSPLAIHAGPIPLPVIAEHTQLVLSDRSSLTDGQDYGVLSRRTWRLADLGTKHAFLRAGLGWGHMPLPLVKDDLAQGHLAMISVAGFPLSGISHPIMALFPTDARPGVAGRWLIERLREDWSKS